jgi:hypothetical protein
MKLAHRPCTHCSSSYEINSILYISVCRAKVFRQQRLRRVEQDKCPVKQNAARPRSVSIRNLRTGQRIHITGSPVSALSTADHPGLNVLATKQAKDSIAQLLGTGPCSVPKLLAGLLADLQGVGVGGTGGLGGLGGLSAQPTGSPRIDDSNTSIE